MIGLVQYRTSFSSSLPTRWSAATCSSRPLRRSSPRRHQPALPLTNELLDGTSAHLLLNGSSPTAVTPPQWLGPTIAATKDKPVRIVFHNLLPTGTDGDLFLPTDSTLMGSGMGPMSMADPVDLGHRDRRGPQPRCSEYPSPTCASRTTGRRCTCTAGSRRDQRRHPAPVDHTGR